MSATVFSQVAIGAADRKNDVLRVEVRRSLNSVGTWMAILRNIGDTYNNTFDVQNQFLLDVNGIGNTLIQGRVDGEAVTRVSKDLESVWDEYVVLRGVDQAQDLLFHNDFDHFYPDITQQLHEVLDDVINIQLAGLTNITYVPGLVSPVVGAVEFREGTSFLTTIQELFKTAGYLFYVSDTYALTIGSSAAGVSASGVILQCEEDNADNNILDIVEVKERDGGKLYNYVKLYGKNPMFDAYTENNIKDIPLGAEGWEPDSYIGRTAGVLDDEDTVRVGSHSVVAFGEDPVGGNIGVELNAPVFHYDSWDFTKGEIGMWVRYDNDGAAPGDPYPPGVGNAAASGNLFGIIEDSNNLRAGYYGTSTTIYEDRWTWCSFPLGEGQRNWMGWVADQWYFLGVGEFLWDDVISLYFFGTDVLQPWNGSPSHLYIDGFTMPEPPIAISENLVSQGSYRRRPYVDHFPGVRTQNALQRQADTILSKHKDTGIDEIRVIAEGNRLLRYAGQSVTIDIPALGLDEAICYMTEINHIIEPYKDISGGYGFDWVTEVTAIPVSVGMYDHTRLYPHQVYSPTQLGSRVGSGVRVK